MREKYSSVELLLSLAMIVMLMTGCPQSTPSEGEGEGEVVIEGEGEIVVEGEGETAARTYVKSAICAGCHPEENSQYILSGHPYKVNKVISGQPPVYPFPTLKSIDNENIPDAPEGFSWDDITYVIGGYGWKALFMNAEGYILTDFTGDDEGTQLTQYNLPEGSPERWLSYSPHAEGYKPYDESCGVCHTTGWVSATETQIADFTNNTEAFQDGLPGIHGTWSEPGVRCEACHGPGSAHIVATTGLERRQTIDRILSDEEDELESKRCGECHFRDTEHRILISGGFISQHAQYDEMLNGGHASLRCVSCHNPHQATKYSPELGIKEGGCTTTACHHTDVTIDRPSMSYLKCIDCHMPSATKSAVKFSDYEGDVKTHIFAINTDPVTADEAMFTTDPPDDPNGTAIVNTANGGAKVTLDFACMRCHSEAGGYSIQTLERLSEVAKLIHGTK